MTLAEPYTFGEREQIALALVPCQSPSRRHEFLRLLHPAGYRDLRAIRQGTNGKSDEISTFSFPVASLKGVDEFADRCKDWNVYVGVAPRAELNKRTADACLPLWALWADLDFKHFASEADARARLASFPLPPSLVIYTGGGLHAYWLLTAPIAVAVVKPLLRALAIMVGADLGSTDPAHILRLPGTLNHKYSPPRPVVAETVTGVRYRLEDLRAALPPVPDEPTATDRTPIDHGVDVEERKRRARLWAADQPAGYTQGCRPDDPDQSGDDETIKVCFGVVNDYDLAADDAFEVLRDWNARCDPPWADHALRAKIRGAAKYAKKARGAKLQLILSPADPLPSAREFVTRHHLVDAVMALRHQAGVFYAYRPDAGAYHDHDEPAVRSDLYQFLEPAQQWTKKTETTPSKLVPFQPTKSKVENVLDALRAICNLPMAVAPPCWLVGATLDPLDMLACPNGLLHIPTRTLYPSTPHFFTWNGIDFPYDAQAPLPEKWNTFLQSLWQNDEESIATVQEMFGYFLTPDTRFQKIFLEVGPKRSGKGLQGRILRRLVGARNVCSPTLAAFGDPFGKQVLIGKMLAIISDARISGRTDTAVVAEALLSISGEDTQGVARKFLPDWTGTLPTRFLLLTNEMPHIGDVSGALASRFIVVKLTQSFYGRENLTLFDQLIPELPGILNWALRGRDRLHRRGHFIQPTSAEELIHALADLSSPEKTFLDECTVIDPKATPEACVSQKGLFWAWSAWCLQNGREKKEGTLQSFSRNVHAALPGVTTRRRGPNVQQERYWAGLVLLESAKLGM